MSRAFVFVILATVFFSTMEITLKGMTGSFNAVQVNVTRFLIGGIFLVPLALRALRRCGSRLDAKGLGQMALLGLLGTVVSMTLYQLAVETTPASVVAVVFCCNAVFVLIFAHFILKTPILRNQVAALAVACLGICVIIDPLDLHLSPAGLFFSLSSPVIFALYAVLATPLCRRYSGVAVTCGTFLLGSLENLLLIAIASIPALAGPLTAHGLGLFCNVPLLTGYTWRTFLQMMYVSVGVSGAGFACYFMAAEAASPFTASLVFFFKPVLAPVLALIFLGENIPLNMVAGILLILGGSLLSMLSQLRNLAAAHALHFRHLRRWQTH